jgi:hypothetical protein
MQDMSTGVVTEAVSGAGMGNAAGDLLDALGDGRCLGASGCIHRHRGKGRGHADVTGIHVIAGGTHQHDERSHDADDQSSLGGPHEHPLVCSHRLGSTPSRAHHAGSGNGLARLGLQQARARRTRALRRFPQATARLEIRSPAARAPPLTESSPCRLTSPCVSANNLLLRHPVGLPAGAASRIPSSPRRPL